VLLDRELFLPKAWCRERERCSHAGIPAEVEQQTKPQLALTMVERALDADVPAAWVTGDEVDGSDGKLRRALEGCGQAYVLAVRSNEYVTIWPPYGTPDQTTVRILLATVPAEGGQRLSCGEGAQGPRLYDWAGVPLRPAERDGWVVDTPPPAPPPSGADRRTGLLFGLGARGYAAG
jgi:SRSO17 transposase